MALCFLEPYVPQMLQKLNILNGTFSHGETSHAKGEFAGIMWIQDSCIGYFLVMKCSPRKLDVFINTNGKIQIFAILYLFESVTEL